MSEVTPPEQPQGSIPAGWYPDPEDPGQQRYWSGQAWTDHRSPLFGTTDHEQTQPLPLTTPATGPGPAPSSSGRPGSGPWWRKPWVLVAGGVLVGAALVSLGSGSTDETTSIAAKPAAPVTATVTATKEVQVTTTVTATPKPKPTKSAGSGSSRGGNTFVVPNEVGKNLQIAQDDLQEASGDPLFVSFSEDATGAGRAQLLDSGWKVCSQDPPAGTRIGRYADVTLYTVRVSETCP